MPTCRSRAATRPYAISCCSATWGSGGETYLLQEENGNLFMNTGFRIDVSYNEATDVLTFSPNGDYVRVKPQPGHPTEE